MGRTHNSTRETITRGEQIRSCFRTFVSVVEVRPNFVASATPGSVLAAYSSLSCLVKALSQNKSCFR